MFLLSRIAPGAQRHRVAGHAETEIQQHVEAHVDLGGQDGTGEARGVIVGITKRFGKVLAVDNLSFTIPAGVIAGFVGPNGSGKTTSMRILATLLKQDAGTATVFGRDTRTPWEAFSGSSIGPSVWTATSSQAVSRSSSCATAMQLR